MAKYMTASDIIKQAASEVGLPAVADPFASPDPAYRQLVSFLTSLGQELVLLKDDWQELLKDFEFNTVIGQAEYALPDDFAAMVPQTGWDVSTRRPLDAVSSQEWHYRDVTGFSGLITVRFRVARGKLQLIPTPASIFPVSFEYRSRSWVKPTGETQATMDRVTVAGDVVMFDQLLVTRGLKLMWLGEKGFDTIKATADFERIYELVAGKDTPKPVLHLSGSGGEPLIGEANLPYIIGG